MSNIAIITARGGSKRIPKKNIKEFCGQPIIAYSIKAAIDSGSFDEVMVSTDSEEIAKIAIQSGAKVPFLRSDKTSNDHATTVDVITEVLDEYSKLGQAFDYFTCIYPTAPFISGEILRDAIERVESSDAEALVPVVRFSFPPQRAFVIKDDKVCYMYPEFEKARSQDLEPIYHDCGQFYICSCDAFNKYKSLITPNTIPYIMPEEMVQDIDNMSDWVIAEAKYKVLQTKKG
ncbi:MAG: pseudaminic acid cytidylyltransferase [Oscillospiraceae bacterium]|nr:pseudaminic acid cytidylyltransferase [Oscillospiraceae bacterium]